MWFHFSFGFRTTREEATIVIYWQKSSLQDFHQTKQQLPTLLGPDCASKPVNEKYPAPSKAAIDFNALWQSNKTGEHHSAHFNKFMFRIFALHTMQTWKQSFNSCALFFFLTGALFLTIDKTPPLCKPFGKFRMPPADKKRREARCGALFFIDDRKEGGSFYWMF
jgi:hypothetical protein